MDRRWGERRAQASARRDPTASIVFKREPPAPPSAAAELPSKQSVLADLQQLEQSGSAHSSSYLSNTTRAMWMVVVVGNTVLLALLYANGFLG